MKRKKLFGKMRIIVALSVSAGTIFALIIFLVLGVYKFNGNNRFFAVIERIIPFPAVYIEDSGFITVGELEDDKAAVKKFYESQDFEKIGMRVDFSTDQGQKRLLVKEKDILNKLVENRIIGDLAQKKGIVLTSSSVKDEMDRTIAQFGNRDNLASDLARLYGWTVADFQEKVVMPEMYGEKLSSIYSSEANAKKEHDKAKLLYEQVIANKNAFSDIARKNSDGKSAENGGDLGWSTKVQLVSEISEKAFSMRVGEISPIIESPLGFHIVRLDEKKTDANEEMVHLSQIFVKKTTFGDWLQEKMKEYSVTVFLDKYKWNKNESRIDFRDPELQKFEQDLPVNSQGDPSVF